MCSYVKVSEDKGIQDFVYFILDHGVAQLRRGKRHYYLLPNNKKVARITIPGTPSDHRSVLNFKAEVTRKIGSLTINSSKGPTMNDNTNYFQLKTAMPIPAAVSVAVATPVEANATFESLAADEAALMAQLEAIRTRKEEVRSANITKWTTDLSAAESDLADATEMVADATDRIAKFKTLLGLSPVATEVKTAVVNVKTFVPKSAKDVVYGAAIADPVLKMNGDINIKATAEKHKIQYMSLRAWVMSKA